MVRGRVIRHRLMVREYLLCSGVLLTLALGALANEAGNSKEEIIRGILSDFQLIYYVHSEDRGKIYDVVIKDFSPGDKETYAIVDQDERFWVIYLPARMEKYELQGTACCKNFPLKKVRRELVSRTRAKGLKRHFTVPLRAEDLPLAK